MTDTLEATKKRALKILGNRNFSEAEMIKRLTGKGESREDAEEAAAWLVELGYINDENYASLIVEHYSSKGYGITRVKDELYKRGIPRELRDLALSALDNESVSEAALVFLRKKLRGGSDENDIRRARDALVRRGFSYEDTKIAINLYLELI